MLTRNNLQRGAGELEPFDPKAGHAHRQRNMAEDEAHLEEENNFRKTFYSMAVNVSQLFLRLKRVEGRKPDEQGSVHGNGGEEPPPSPSTSEISSSSHHHHHRNSRDASKKPFFNLYVKFDPPMFNGESNVEKINNWIRQIEIYCRIQQIIEDEVKIKLASLWLGSTTLVWWESKLQSSKNVGKLFSSWSDFTSALKEHFYPLGYKQKALMNWQYLRQGKAKGRIFRVL